LDDVVIANISNITLLDSSGPGAKQNIVYQIVLSTAYSAEMIVQRMNTSISSGSFSSSLSLYTGNPNLRITDFIVTQKMMLGTSKSKHYDALNVILFMCDHHRP
jgi:hypothetical protein